MFKPKEGVEKRVLTGAAELARRYPEKPKQLNTFDDVDELIKEAEAANEPMHVAMRTLVEGVGGDYGEQPSRLAHFSNLRTVLHRPLLPTCSP